MRRNSTLPLIKEQPKSLRATPTGGSKQTVRKLEDKLSSHDSELLKNDQIIMNLAGQFKVLKEQLQFEQTYNQKYKSTLGKCEEENAKYLKTIKDQKATIQRMQLTLKGKDKKMDNVNSYIVKVQQMTADNQLLQRQVKKKEMQLKTAETQIQKLKKQWKEREGEMKEDQQNFRAGKQSKIKKLQKEVELLNVYLQNSKEALQAKDSQIQQLNETIAQLQTETNQLNTGKTKIAQTGAQLQMRHKQIQGLTLELQNSRNQVQSLKAKIEQMELRMQQNELIAKNLEQKMGSQLKQINKKLTQDKFDLNDKIIRLNKDLQLLKKRLQNEYQLKEATSKGKKDAQAKLQKIQAHIGKLNAFKTDIGSQLTQLKANTLCDHCGKPMKNPVTNIPCGHSYCQECKVGYVKECKKCPDVKRQAVYRNQLLDEIIQASSLVQKILKLLQ